jgi:2-methylisocitrate lyase-like PEP mutase family enzyme
MTDSSHSLAARFRELHRPGRPLLMANPWDAGSAKLLASIGFQALATTSGGHAATLGKLDGNVGREAALQHAAEIVAAVDVPVSADLEDGFGAEPDAVAATVRKAVAVGLAGCSIEDWSATDGTIFPFDLAVERVRAAAEAAHGTEGGLVLTARAENHIRDNPDLDDTIARLQAFQEAGADVLYAPGLSSLDDIRRVIEAVDRPVNVLALPGAPPVAELAEAGAARLSVGSAFALVAFGAVVEAGRELLDQGTYGFWERAVEGSRHVHRAFKD